MEKMCIRLLLVIVFTALSLDFLYHYFIMSYPVIIFVGVRKILVMLTDECIIIYAI